MKRDHIVPLSGRMIAILEEARALGSEKWIFPSPFRKAQHLSTGAFDKRIDEANLTGKVTAHGMRSAFKDWSRSPCINGQRVDDDVSEMCLAHAIRDKVKAAYARDDLLDERRPVMQAWADYICGVEPANNVADIDKERRKRAAAS